MFRTVINKGITMFTYLADMSYKDRKDIRRIHYEKFVGWKERKCGACSGSGYYDDNGSPKCGSCSGTGKEKYKPELEKIKEI